MQYRETDDLNPIGDVVSRRLGSFQLNRTSSHLPHVAIRTEQQIHHSHQDCYWMCFVLSGNSHLRHYGHKTDLVKGDFFLLDSTRPYIINIEEDFDGLWIGTSRTMLDSRLLNINRNIGCKISSDDGIANLVFRMIEAISQEFPRFSVHEGKVISNSLLDILCTIYGNTGSVKTASPTTHRLSLLSRIEKFIDENVCDNSLSPALIAREQDISVRYLNRLFESEGISVTRWIWLQRLERCRRKLEDPAQSLLSISEVAYSCGFKNISHFNRVFKKYFGCSPRTYRETHLKDYNI